MEYVCTTLVGVEDLLEKEAKKFGLQARIVKPGRVNVSGNISEFEQKTRFTQNIIKVAVQFSFSSKEEILAKEAAGKFKEVICNRAGDHEFSSQEIRNAFTRKVQPDKSAEKALYIDIVDEVCTIGILETKKRLSTRPYYVRINQQSVPPLIAAAAVEFSSFNSQEPLGDPFCRDGIILIEASYLGFEKLCGVDLENNIRNARINAQVARKDIELGEGHFEDLAITSQIITRPFEFFSRFPQEKVEKKIKKFFELQKERNVSLVTLIMTCPGAVIDCAKEYGFVCEKQKSIKSGELLWQILCFRLASVE